MGYNTSLTRGWLNWQVSFSNQNSLNNMKKIISILAFGIYTATVFSQASFITNVDARVTQSLNGKWKYIMDPYETGRIGFIPLYQNIKPINKTDRVEYSFDNAQTLWVPGSWNAQKEILYFYEGSIWYRKTFDFKPKLENSRVFIYVGAANYKTQITFNGKKIGEHEGGFTPFSVEVTDLIRDKGNFVILGVNNRRENDYIPSKVTDWYNYGGITRDVKIVELPRNYIDDFTIYLKKETVSRHTKVIEGVVKLVCNKKNNSAFVEIPELNLSQIISIDSEGNGSFSFSTSNVQLWNPENPKLYSVIIRTDEDQLNDKVGFRTIETRGKELLLNGESIFLKGISIHDENPIRKDRANSVDDAKLVLGWAKELGCNFARLAHYPHQENIVRLADEMGILLWEELPLYWGINWQNEDVLHKAKHQYSELIRRDKNRAATIIWSITNETHPSKARNQFLSEIANHVKKEDSSRLISGACVKDSRTDGDTSEIYVINDPIGELFDIVSFNEYLGWYGGRPEECRKKNFKIAYNKPVIVSEFGGGAIQGYHGDSTTRWSEEYQEYLYKQAIAMFERVPGLVGMTPWILVDFQSPLRQLPDVQDGWNRKGLISETGAKKKAFYVLKDYYKRK